MPDELSAKEDARYFFCFARIDSISSMIEFIRATSAWYGSGVVRSTPAALTSSYG
jgi:hypothetical protein